MMLHGIWRQVVRRSRSHRSPPLAVSSAIAAETAKPLSFSTRHARIVVVSRVDSRVSKRMEYRVCHA